MVILGILEITALLTWCQNHSFFIRKHLVKHFTSMVLGQKVTIFLKKTGTEKQIVKAEMWSSTILSICIKSKDMVFVSAWWDAVAEMWKTNCDLKV